MNTSTSPLSTKIVFLILDTYVYPIIDPLIQPFRLSFRVESLDIGNFAPRVEVMKRVVSNSTNNIVMDTRVKFISDLELILLIKFRDHEIRVRVRDLVLDLLAPRGGATPPPSSSRKCCRSVPRRAPSFRPPTLSLPPTHGF